jgi:hypothetical protein
MKEEEGWKTFLNWGAVSMFLGMPVAITILQIYALSHPNWLSEKLPQTEFKYLYEFQRALAILVFGLSGLRTWEVVKEKNGKHNGNRKTD